MHNTIHEEIVMTVNSCDPGDAIEADWDSYLDEDPELDGDCNESQPCRGDEFDYSISIGRSCAVATGEIRGETVVGP